MIKQETYERKFKSGGLPYAHDPYEIREKDFLDRAKNAYGAYCSDSLAIGFGGYTMSGRSYKELREYGRSMQSAEKYMEVVDKTISGADGRQYHRHNISKDIARPLLKYRNILKSKLTGLNMAITTQANDPTAVHEKEQLIGRMKFMADQRTRGFVNQTGYAVPEMDAVKGFEGPDDVDMFEKLGGITLNVEMMMKDGIDISMEDSRWSATKEIYAEDLIDLNAVAYHVYTDMTSGRVMFEYVDPDRLLVDTSVYPDHADAGKIGFVSTRKISDIRQRMGELSPEKEAAIRKAAIGFRGSYNNNAIMGATGHRLAYSRGNGGNNPFSDIDDVSVDVLTLYFVDTQAQRFVKRRNKNYGNMVFDEVGPESTAKGAEIVDNVVHTVYKVEWVVGSEVLVSYGVADDVVRAGFPGSKRAIPNIVCYIGQDPSFTEQCIGDIDDINLAVFKRRVLISKLPPGPRMILDMAGLKDSVMLGEEELSIVDSLKNYALDGVLIVESEGEYAMPGQEASGTAKRPITFMESGISEDIAILTNEVIKGIQSIQHTTGFNPTTDGTGGSPDMLKHVAEAATQATNAANAPMVNAWVNTYERLAKLLAMKWQLRVLAGDVDYNTLPTSGATIERAKLSKEMFHHDWNIFVKVDDTMTKEVLMQDLMSKKDSIPPEVYYQVLMCITTNDLKRAQVILIKNIEKSNEVAHQRQIEIQKSVAEGNAMAAQATEQAKAQTAATTWNFKKEEMLLDERIKINLLQEEYRLKKTLPTPSFAS